jgi:hypothetical protein
VAAIWKPTKEVRFPIVWNGDGMSFSRSELAEKASRPVCKREEVAIRRDRGTEDRIVLGVAGQAAFREANGGGGAMPGVPANDNASDKNDRDNKGETPKAVSWRDLKTLFLGDFGLPRHGSEKPIPTAGKSFNKPGIFRGIAQGVAEAFDGSIEAVIEINEGIGWPEFGAEFFAGNKFTGPGQEKRQDLERLFLQPDFGAVPAKFPGAEVNLKYPKGNEAVGFVFRHWK